MSSTRLSRGHTHVRTICVEDELVFEPFESTVRYFNLRTDRALTVGVEDTPVYG